MIAVHCFGSCLIQSHGGIPRPQRRSNVCAFGRRGNPRHLYRCRLPCKELRDVRGSEVCQLGKRRRHHEQYSHVHLRGSLRIITGRSVHVIFAGTLVLLFSDIWYASVTPLEVGWVLNQTVYMLPTMLMLPSFCVVWESPRWLIAKAHFEEAEAVMMIAATINHFPIHNTTLAIDKLKTAMARNAIRLPSIYEDMLGGYSIRRRALILSLSCLSIKFSTFAQHLHRRMERSLGTP
ncbi:hypothetical protein MRX96_005654 [Rhipicephalus microplus]